ncbi:hypothetical protein EJ06DRAFT_528131 [Trichodelitschia bisporula]|uniref:DNA/RNA-binding protein Kin17 WH-like domain-containing protein n=1 Tax=Trichodelitschia bisporula TaxID=703511 RepID=A0A6G1I537_9PEZI|nr:hypothetical protein EJ06DRAFT_528131 [Trichodelitschia bisporula]
MPKAEVGSSKWLGNKMKAKGLQRLRWYCQACEKQCRDENGFKQHTLSEGHVRAMHAIGENPKKALHAYSSQFKRDFLTLLRTAHGEKSVHANHFYQEYIANKEHIHMNSTHWNSLTEFVKHLGREGICRVTETDKGLHVAWIDNSPEALRRQDAVRKRERLDRGDEEREQEQILEQVERAQRKAREAELAKAREAEMDPKPEEPRKEVEKVVIDLGALKAGAEKAAGDAPPPPATADQSTDTTPAPSTPAPPAPVSLSFSANPKPKNVFTAAKKNPLNAKKTVVKEPPKKMSEAERIMKEELERKRFRDEAGGGGKRMKFNMGGQ